ncbi:DUF3035 domain-containing protein [Rhizosaccharibacter radicis]|uniref:DUF3035 domain-containing protein n=1 Tax=Rhizosaccharibacter radicis TaxID=2782605 RepID=A0ABT1W2I8_9PROT|nr:DUF3035 domain-containing protein [Acetobacteraceae bacterium KSS12]
MASRSILLMAALGAVPLLSGCTGEQIEREFGMTRASPDEYTVTTRAPLSIPPSEQISPPTPGVEQTTAQSSQTQALESIAPNVALQGTGGTDSAGQQALIAGAASSSRNAADNGALDHPGQGFVNELMFWQGSGGNEVVDGAAEKRRLQENAALGRSPTAGATPTVKASKPGFFDRLF